jgi:hypothetical protein
MKSSRNFNFFVPDLTDFLGTGVFQAFHCILGVLQGIFSAMGDDMIIIFPPTSLGGIVETPGSRLAIHLDVIGGCHNYSFTGIHFTEIVLGPYPKRSQPEG